MRILFDQNTPTYLRGVFSGHEVRTCFQMGWSQLQNGRLLEQAEASGFDLLLTLDKNMRFQRNLTGKSISIAILAPFGREKKDLLDTCARNLKEIVGMVQGQIRLFT